jgi:hypothetical protein
LEGSTVTIRYTNATEEYDGSTWTSGGNLATGKRLLAGCGLQTAALGFGGDICNECYKHRRI